MGTQREKKKKKLMNVCSGSNECAFDAKKVSLQQHTSSNQLKPLTIKIFISKHTCTCLSDTDIFKLQI